MSIDLSTLQIPDVSVVPEPTAEHVADWWKIKWTLPYRNQDLKNQIICSLARRCRDLEERDRQAAEAYAAKCETQRYLEAEIERLRTRLLTAAGDDFCRLNQNEINAMSAGVVKIPPKEEFLASCERFHAQVANEAGVMTNCLTLAQLVAENENLRAEIEQLRNKKCVHDLAREFSKETTNVY